MSSETINFATIGEIFEDGVSLIFDGQDAATEKHYKVNTSIVFHEGDRVKILADSGTYVVEYVVGTPKVEEPEGEPGEETDTSLPGGGTTGQALVKASDKDNDVSWGLPNGVVPTGGKDGQVLKKTSATDYAMAWEDEPGGLPTGGTAGQVLVKDSTVNYDVSWGNPTGTLPTGGTTGQVLKKTSGTNYAVGWADAPAGLPTGGSNGQVLVKSGSTNYAASWGTVSGTLPTGGTDGQCLLKSGTTNYSTKWGSPTMANAVVNQYRPTYDNYQIQFQTDVSGNFFIRQGTSGTWKKITVG